MNEALQNLEIKVENGGTTPQGRLTSSEWNILVAAVKALDADSDDADVSDVLQIVEDAGYATQNWVNGKLTDYATQSSLNALSLGILGKANKATTLAGYGITDAYTKSHIDSNFVTIGTKQQITGEKDFVGGFKVNGGLVEYNATLKAWVFNGDLLVTGGMAAFSNISGFKPSTITEAVLIDNKTIKLNADGLLYAVPQGAGGINEDQLADYLTTNGYATQSWVTGKGYITGITSAMVTNALEYTPYNSANFTKANIKSTLGISDWALASTKPAYTASEVGALASNGTASAAWKLANARYLWGQLFDGSANISGQISFNAGDFILAHNATDAWTDANGLTHPWYGIDFRVAGSYKGYISHWNGIALVSGNDITLSSQKNVIVNNGNFRIDQTAFDNGLILNRTAANSGVGIVAMSKDVRLGTFGINGTKTFEIAGDNGIVAQVSTVTGEATFNGMTTIKHSGNTPLVINQTYATNNSRGVVLMNGSMANSHMYYSHLFGKEASSKNSAYVGFYNAGAGSDSNYLSMGLYGVNNVLNILGSGKVVIGGTTASEKLHVYGNILATGGVTATNSSDERLKRNLRKFNASKVLMSLGGVWEYEYVDSEVAKNHIYEGTHYGLIYQNVKGTTLDVMCHERDDGFGTLNYIHPKFISLIAGATMANISEVEKLKREIRHLKAKVKQLEQRA